MISQFKNLLDPFREHIRLHECLLHVLQALPSEVIDDFLSDPNFRIALDDYSHGKGRTVWLAGFGPEGTSSRSVVLKPKLDRCSEKFTRYIVAHELAHAFLHNGGWGEITDREEAADALATSWGFAPEPWER